MSGENNAVSCRQKMEKKLLPLVDVPSDWDWSLKHICT